MDGIEYTPAPTVADFIKSEAFYNFIVGPVGPVAAETEYLTPQGWKRIDEYIPGDWIAQWTPDPGGDPAAGSMEFVEPLDYIVTSADELIHFHNQHSLSMVLSDEHRLPYYDYRSKFQVTSAGGAARHPSSRQIPVSFVPTGMPGTGLSEALLRLAVAIHADGHFPATSPGSTARAEVCIITVRKERKKQRLRNILEAVGIEWGERSYATRPTETIFSFASPYLGKSFDTKQWWGATAEELQIILEELAYWDGLFEGMDTRFSTTLKGDADFIQYAAHTAGGRATISRYDYPEHPRWHPTYTVHIAPPGSDKARVRLSNLTDIERVPTSDGQQYCFCTPSTYFVARHDGRVFVTGNSSKTTGLLFKIVYHAMRQKPSPRDGIRRTRWVVVRNTMPQLKDTTINSFMMWFKPGQAGVWKSSYNTFVFKFDDVEAEVMFRPLDTPEDVRRVLSLEVTGAILDEFVEIPKEIVEALSGRCGRYPGSIDGGVGWFGMWGASNPGNEDDWWFDWLYDEPPANLAYFEQPGGFEPGAENLDNLPENYYQNLAEGKSQEWINQFINVKWGFSLRGTPVYKAFRTALHVAKETIPYNPHRAVVVGFDAGLTPSAVIGQQDSAGRILVLGELTSDNMGARRFCQEKLLPYLRHRCPDCALEVVGDPAFTQRAQTDERSVRQILEEELKIKPRPAPTNALVARVGAVEDVLTRLTDLGPAYMLDPSCKTLIRGFTSGYHYAISQKGRKADSPEKNAYSHPHDANQYMCLAFTSMDREAKKRKDVARLIAQNRQQRARYNVG